MCLNVYSMSLDRLVNYQRNKRFLLLHINALTLISQQYIRYYLFSELLAIQQELEKLQIFHGDLKPANIMIKLTSDIYNDVDFEAIDYINWSTIFQLVVIDVGISIEYSVDEDILDIKNHKGTLTYSQRSLDRKSFDNNNNNKIVQAIIYDRFAIALICIDVLRGHTHLNQFLITNKFTKYKKNNSLSLIDAIFEHRLQDCGILTRSPFHISKCIPLHDNYHNNKAILKLLHMLCHKNLKTSYIISFFHNSITAKSFKKYISFNSV